MEYKMLQPKSRNSNIIKSTSGKCSKQSQHLAVKLIMENRKPEANENSVMSQISSLTKEKNELYKLLKTSERIMDEKRIKYAYERENIKKIFVDILPIIESCITTNQKKQIMEFINTIQKSTASGCNSQESQCNLMKYDEDNASTLCTNRDRIQCEISKHRAQIESNKDALKTKKEMLVKLNSKIGQLQKDIKCYQRMYAHEIGPSKVCTPSFFQSLR